VGSSSTDLSIELPFHGFPGSNSGTKSPKEPKSLAPSCTLLPESSLVFVLEESVGQPSPPAR